MNRLESVSLLNELIVSFRSARDATIVSIERIKDSSEWDLRIKWVATKLEDYLLSEIMTKHNVGKREEKGCTIFR